MCGVQFALLSFQFDGEHVLEFVGQVGEHVFFQTAFDEQSHQCLQFVGHDGMFRTGSHDRLLVFFAEFRIGEAMVGRDLFDRFGHLCGMVFDVLRLVERHQREMAGCVIVHVATQQIVGGDHHVGAVVRRGAIRRSTVVLLRLRGHRRDGLASLRFRTGDDFHRQIAREFLAFRGPVVDERCRADDE